MIYIDNDAITKKHITLTVYLRWNVCNIKDIERLED